MYRSMHRGMMVVHLDTHDNKFVSYADVAPFPELPDVVWWGDRCFIYTGRFEDVSGAQLGQLTRVPVYREGHAVWVVDPTPRSRP